MIGCRARATARPLACAVAALAFASAAGACKGEKKPSAHKSEDGLVRAAFDAAAAKSPVYIDPATIDFAKNPLLLERVLASAYGYLRFSNIPFSRAVCQRFAGRLRGMPTVNLHGDAHLENYAVTTNGRGLSDFDDSSAGPAIIDLVRFGAAIDVACNEKGWADDAPKLIEMFLKGYRDALKNPEVEASVPDLVVRIRKTFTSHPMQFLEYAESLMQPISMPERAEFEPGYLRYSELMLSEHPELPKEFFQIQKFGRLTVGFGSALDKKFLIRVRGKTNAPEDDLVLEAKEVRDLSGIQCINSRKSGGAFRILVGQARIAEIPHRFLAQIPRGADTSGPTFWVHAWHENYVELTLAGSVTPQDLEQVVYDVGVQLGRGHVRQIASPLDSQLRKAQLDALNVHAQEIREAITVLSAQTHQGWQQFRADAKRLNLTP